MIRVLTVAREFGSGGASIARLVADRMHWKLMDREIVDEVIRIAGVDRDSVERCDERLDSTFQRVLKSLWHGGFEQSTTAFAPAPFDSEEMSRCARTVIETAAEQGSCVIVGRGGQCLLSDRKDALHVFLWAPRACRLQRVRTRFPGERDPEGVMDRVDRERSAFIRREFDANWCDHRLYDLIINTAIGDAATADCIAAGIRGA